MKAIIETTITVVLDLNTFDTDTKVEIDDKDGLSAISSDILYSAALGGVRSAEAAIIAQIPRLARGATTDETD